MDEGSPTDVNISITEEAAPMVPKVEVSIDTVAVAVLMTATEGILVTTLVTMLVTSTVVMVWVSLINDTAAGIDGMRLWETTNVESRRLDGFDETDVLLVEVDFSARLAVD